MSLKAAWALSTARIISISKVSDCAVAAGMWGHTVDDDGTAAGGFILGFRRSAKKCSKVVLKAMKTDVQFAHYLSLTGPPPIVSHYRCRTLLNSWSQSTICPNMVSSTARAHNVYITMLEFRMEFDIDLN